MQNFINNFKYYYELFPVKEINDKNIVFSTKELPFEFYIPGIQKAFLDEQKNPTRQYNYEEVIYNEIPNYNMFNFLEHINKEQLYLEFANLLSPKNKKEKIDKIKNIKDFISTYGYIFKLNLEELKADEISRPLSEIETEIKKFNTILTMQNIIDSAKKNKHLKLIPKIQYLDILLKGNEELHVYASLYDFSREIEIANNETLSSILNLFKHCISILTNKEINNCKINYTYYLNSEPKYEIYCNSLLELMYLQFVTDVSNSNNEIRYM